MKKVLLCVVHYEGVLSDVLTKSEWEVGEELGIEITEPERCEVCKVEAESWE